MEAGGVGGSTEEVDSVETGGVGAARRRLNRARRRLSRDSMQHGGRGSGGQHGGG